MKRLLRLLLLLTILGAIPLGVGATENHDGISREIDVTARYKAVSTAPASYSVDLHWSDMDFTYTKEETLIWNPENHSYTARGGGGWEKTRASITVTNHSNVAVQVTITYTPIAGNGITGTLKNASGTLKAGAVGDYLGADSMTATLTISGTPKNLPADTQTKIGSLKVTIQ